VTEVPKADGKGVKSELDILVRDGLKSKVPIKQYSGGEKAAISLAITGAFWDLASQQSSGAVNVLLLDEPFGGADAYGEEKACRLFESMRESGRVIFVVTNRQGVRERGKFDREVRAVKEGHISHIEQYDLSGEH
jgi:DNA repair exonuclease SbcCD ATPase subunit